MAVLDPRDPEAYQAVYGNEEQEELHEHHRLLTDPGQKSLRVDVFLSNILKNVSRSRIKNASMAGCVRVNGASVKASYKVKPGQELSLLLPYPPSPELEPEDVPLNFHYEDDSFLLINKDPGMVVHPGFGNWTGTMIHGILWHHVQNNPEGTAREDLPRVGLVHRIDKDTSGLLVVGKTDYALSFLSRQFFEKTTKRRYWAIVWGDVKEDNGTVVGYIGRSKKDRKKFTVHEKEEDGKHAVTHYTVLERFGFCTLVECRLETGRTHQIRVHMKHIGHTLFSDVFYGGGSVLSGPKNQGYVKFINACLAQLPRQALHAKTLGFIHPETNEAVEFNSSLPADFAGCLEMMREYVKI